jgi:hypothetical protein
MSQDDSQTHLAILTLTDLTASEILAGWSELQFPNGKLSPLIAVKQRNFDFL